MRPIESLEPRRLLTSNIVADFGGIYPTDSVTVNDISYFTANDGAHGRELWRSDGTPGGTRMVRDITAGPGWSDIREMFALTDRLVFVKIDGNSKNRCSIWASDGTADGTFRLSSAGAPTTHPAALAGDHVVFTATHSSDVELSSSTLWVTDGTPAGTTVLRDFPNTANQYQVFNLYSVGPRAIAIARTLSDALNTSTGSMWSTDGTVGGTIELTNAPQISKPITQVSSPIIAAGKLYFINNEALLCSTDGTVEGTVQVASGNGVLDVISVRAAGEKVFFQTRDPQGDDWLNQLWVTDGTEQGTVKLASFANMLDLITATDFNGKLAFFAGIPEHPYGVWVSDGTSVGTSEVFSGPTDVATSPFNLQSAGSQLFFEAYYQWSVGTQLWHSDGTAQGTSLVRAFTSAETSDERLSTAVVDAKLLLRINDQTLLFDPASYATPIGPKQGRTEIVGGILRIYGTRKSDLIKLYDVADNPDRFIVNLNGTRRSFAFADIARIWIYGYSGDDNIAVNERAGKFAGRSRIWSGSGNDTVWTGTGRDTVWAEAGDDQVFGGNNNDLLSGGDGNDTLVAGNGDDSVCGDSGADTVQGNKGSDIVSGGNDSSKDILDGGDGADVLFGQAVYDTFFSPSSDAGLAVDEILQS